MTAAMIWALAAAAGSALLLPGRSAGAEEPPAGPADLDSDERNTAMTSSTPEHPYAAADALFRSDPRWRGSDAVLSIPLSADRTLWLYGDTFILPPDVPGRSLDSMVRNTVSLQTGMDPRTAEMTFHWRTDPNGKPASFFPEQGERWFWPGHGIRLEEGPLVIFLYGFLPDPDALLHFKFDGWGVAVIDNPDDSPEHWRPRFHEAAAEPGGVAPATAVVRDGDHVVCLAIEREKHAGALVRYPAAALARGDTSGAEWWMGEDRGWVPEAEIGPDGPVFIMDDAGAEASLHWDPRANAFLHVASYGFGASTIGIRRAPALTGPWSAPEMVYRPPESDGPEPFVYAAKAHPEIMGPEESDLVITYATNHFDFNKVVTPEGCAGLYWPRAVCVRIGPAGLNSSIPNQQEKTL